MTPHNPHYLLFSEAKSRNRASHTWRFVLQDVESQRRFTATDTEPTDCGERLELLAVVRGLEALDGPARVTLVTKSRYVSRGMKTGLSEWRANDWRWERFGRIVPVKDYDLWQRVDRALRIHQVDCQAWQFDEEAESRAQNFTSSSISTATQPHAKSNLRKRHRVQQQHSKTRSASPSQERERVSSGERFQHLVSMFINWPASLRAATRPMRQAFGSVA